ncbi:DUF1801 domain-containing protein [Christiangramia forsetii]|uniref:YdhG-like domain-containing protein n=2 Tax=Christiangramia forsetii TaxID=411153 RepID=A0M3H9_CHRFK|nr:DUF1801 domain-containing protein [Christiangramia forsetii]GGG25837.1 hypothetical protein GCM10011532_06470 [Christiangramia forsetii]CAL67174.1 conserved hypothetical protein [Christiangramia forsetii KT0803]
MKIEANSPDEYLENVPEERKEPMVKLRSVIKDNLPLGFEETMSYGMIGYVVPHSIYPDGYHCDTSLPLPFMNLASQKNYIAVYHLGIYANNEMHTWFINEFKKRTGKKPDMGKSCIRLKNIETIPYDLIGNLSSKITPQEWIATYENNVKKK